MPSLTVRAGCKSASLSAEVIRCGCTANEKRANDWHGIRGMPCPRPRTVEQRGVIAYWHQNPLRRLAWRLRHLFH